MAGTQHTVPWTCEKMSPAAQGTQPMRPVIFFFSKKQLPRDRTRVEDFMMIFFPFFDFFVGIHHSTDSGSFFLGIFLLIHHQQSHKLSPICKAANLPSDQEPRSFQSHHPSWRAVSHLDSQGMSPTNPQQETWELPVTNSPWFQGDSYGSSCWEWGGSNYLGSKIEWHSNNSDESNSNLDTVRFIASANLSFSQLKPYSEIFCAMNPQKNVALLCCWRLFGRKKTTGRSILGTHGPVHLRPFVLNVRHTSVWKMTRMVSYQSIAR